MFTVLKKLAATVKQEIRFYRLLVADARTPRCSRWLLVAAVGYVLMPFDLIPDVIPVIGHLDDAIIVPLLLWLGLTMIPEIVIQDCRKRAVHIPARKTSGV